jgi:UDP-glucose 4-epimerase
MLSGAQAVINGAGTQTRDYVYVGDVVRANVSALEHRGSDCFNVGTGKETDVNTLFRLIQDHTRVAMAEKHMPALKGEQLRSVLDCRKIGKILGWAPEVGLQEGLRLTVEFFRKEQVHGT